MKGRSRPPILFLIRRARTALIIVARSFSAYLSRPCLAADARTELALSPLMVGLCLLALSLAVTAMLGVVALPLLLMSEAAPGAQLQQIFSQPIPSVVLAVIILGPVIEEITFRGWLSGTSRAVFGSALFVALALGAAPSIAEAVGGFAVFIQLGLVTLGLAALRMLSPIDGGKPLPHFNRIFPYLFWAQGLIFGILHFRNVAASSSAIAILATLPLVICAWPWGYARIVIGLRAAILLHAAYNVPALLGMLAWMILQRP